MTLRPRVLFDVDGVTANFSGATSRTLEALGGTPFTAEQVVEWDLNVLIGSHKDAMYRAWRSEGWCRNIEPYPGAIDGIRRIREVADVYFVTAPFYEAPHWSWERLNWLKAHFGATDYEVAFVHDKIIVQGDFLVEDRPKNIEVWAKAWPSNTVVIWDQPYTRKLVDPPNSFRTRSWDALIKRVGSWRPPTA